MTSFPRTTVGGMSLPRMLIGTNWILGFSHRTGAANQMIKARNMNRQAICEIIEAYLQYGVDAIMAPIYGNDVLMDGISDAEARTGKKIIRIDTPVINVDDNPQARAEAERKIAGCQSAGADFCLIHHSSAEQLVNKNISAMPRLPDYLSMIRDHGMRPGLSAHMPELIIYSDENEYDVETYIQLYNCAGFMMQLEVEGVNRIIWNAKKPVMTIKAMAAGRVTPFVGLTFSYATLRPIDMVTVGCMTPGEVHEDVEIALAAIERRQANLSDRGSPVKTVLVGGND